MALINGQMSQLKSNDSVSVQTTTQPKKLSIENIPSPIAHSNMAGIISFPSHVSSDHDTFFLGIHQHNCLSVMRQSPMLFGHASQPKTYGI